MPSTADIVAAKLLSTLRAVRPSRLRVYGENDDEPREIAVPERRRRWPQVIATINAFPWDKVEMLDKGKAVLGYVDNAPDDLPVPDLKDLATSAAAKPGASQFELALGVAELLLRAQTAALEARDKETRAMFTAQREVMEAMTSGMRSLTELYQEQIAEAREQAEARIEQQQELAEAAAEAAEANAAERAQQQDDGAGGELREFMQAWPMIQQLLPMLKNMAASAAGNGS